MRRTRMTLLPLLMVALAGCLDGPSRPDISPPHVEQYNTAPKAALFDRPPQYPKEYLNQPLPRKDGDPAQPGGPIMGSAGTPGMGGAGMGGPGMGGGGRP